MAKLFFFISVLFSCISCNSNSESRNENSTSTSLLPGEKIYIDNCKLCHGKDGTLGLTGATNLKTSSLTLEQRIEVIANGRNAMASFKGIIDDEQILEVASYLENLKQTD